MSLTDGENIWGAWKFVYAPLTLQRKRKPCQRVRVSLGSCWEGTLGPKDVGPRPQKAEGLLNYEIFFLTSGQSVIISR